MGTLKVNGDLCATYIRARGGSTENSSGANFKNGSLYLYGKVDSDTRGLYDSIFGSIISVGDSAIFYGTSSNSDKLDGYHASSFLQLSGGTMSGALNFANNTWNSLGDDVYFGDSNVAGTFCIKGINGTTGLRWIQYGGSNYGEITFDGSNFNISNYINGTISKASQWATARTISLSNAVSGSATIDGSGNVNISTNIKFAAVPYDGTLTSKFRTLIKGNASSEQFLSTIRAEGSCPGQLTAYGAGLAWGTHDTQGYLCVDYSSPCIIVGGGNGDNIRWTKELAFTDSTVAGANYANSAGNATTCNGIQLEWSGSMAWGDTAWIAAWSSDGSKIKALNKDNFAPASHSHNYLPTTGGTLWKHTWFNYSNIGDATLLFNPSSFDNQLEGTHYDVWIGGSHGINGYGYVNTVTMGLYHNNAPSDAGFFIGTSWDHSNSDTFYTFDRHGRFTTNRLIVKNYGTSFPGDPHYGEVYFYTG